MSLHQQYYNQIPLQSGTASPNNTARYGQHLPPDVEAEIQWVSDRFDALFAQLRAKRGQRWASLGLEIGNMIHYRRWIEVDATDDEDHANHADDEDNIDGSGVLVTDADVDVEDNDEDDEDEDEDEDDDEDDEFTTIDHTDPHGQDHTQWGAIQDHHPELGFLAGVEEVQIESVEEESEQGNIAESSTTQTHNHPVPVADADPHNELTDPRTRRALVREVMLRYQLGRMDWTTYHALIQALLPISADLLAEQDNDVDLDEEEDYPVTPAWAGPTEYDGQHFPQLSGGFLFSDSPNTEDAVEDQHDEDMTQLERVSSTSTIRPLYPHPDLQMEDVDYYYEAGNVYEDDNDNSEDVYDEEVPQLEYSASSDRYFYPYLLDDGHPNLEEEDYSYYNGGGNMHEKNNDNSEDGYDEGMPQLESSALPVHQFYPPYFLEDGHPGLEEEDDDYHSGGSINDDNNGEDEHDEEVSQLQRMSLTPAVLCLYTSCFEDSGSQPEDQYNSDYEADIGENDDDDSEDYDDHVVDEQQHSEPDDVTGVEEDSAPPKPQEIDVSHIDFDKHHDRLDWRAYTIYVSPEPAPRDQTRRSLYDLLIVDLFLSMLCPYLSPSILIAVVLMVFY